MYEIKSGRIKPKKEPMFGKKPYKGKNKNRTGRTVKTERIKEVYNGSNKPKINDDDKAYLEWLDTQRENYGCFVCGRTCCNEWHHIKLYSTDSKNHKRLIALCGEEHHRLGQELSAHGTPKKWRETYSMEEQNEFADKIYADYLAEKS